ncbi:MAG: hypothetical protein ACTHMY_22805 [Solirubrobacteraceae bacterium]
MLVTLALILVAMLALAVLELWLFWTLGEWGRPATSDASSPTRNNRTPR